MDLKGLARIADSKIGGSKAKIKDGKSYVQLEGFEATGNWEADAKNYREKVQGIIEGLGIEVGKSYTGYACSVGLTFKSTEDEFKEQEEKIREALKGVGNITNCYHFNRRQDNDWANVDVYPARGDVAEWFKDTYGLDPATKKPIEKKLEGAPELAKQIHSILQSVDGYDGTIQEVVDGLNNGEYFPAIWYTSTFEEDEFGSRDELLDAIYEKFEPELKEAAEKIQKILPEGWEATGWVDAEDINIRIEKVGD